MKTLLITGASKGLGYHCKKYFEDIYNVITYEGREDIDFNDLEALELDINETILKCKINKVIHCAGGGFGLKDDLISKDDLQILLNVNLIVPIIINNAVLPEMLINKEGNIVHIISTAARFASASLGYTIAKAGLMAYVRTLGRKLAKYNVVMTGIIPGTFISKDNNWDRYIKEQPEWLDDFIKERCPKGRLGNVEEIIPLIEFLLSDKATMMNGCCVPIDGGEGVTFP